ncbi:hypothetical protein IW261DRAFT_1003753 [Armillaria novae-zelandiae]|uniref:Uncharacterized protein n=1 Tax=Armillaria novae-zelandiae TaxID=153914 RepID=A0AA39NRI3_9AGAR|nr:hypothetical protein IW261DRAFT_1003753 [Armillaria novae-zelandiae]
MSPRYLVSVFLYHTLLSATSFDQTSDNISHSGPTTSLVDNTVRRVAYNFSISRLIPALCLSLLSRQESGTLLSSNESKRGRWQRVSLYSFMVIIALIVKFAVMQTNIYILCLCIPTGESSVVQSAIKA